MRFSLHRGMTPREGGSLITERDDPYSEALAIGVEASLERARVALIMAESNIKQASRKLHALGSKVDPERFKDDLDFLFSALQSVDHSHTALLNQVMEAKF